MSIQWLDPSELGDRSALRRQVVLTEFGLGHVPAFRQVFVDHFAVTGRALPEAPGWFRTPAGNLYEVVLTARSGEPVPGGLEVAALPERFTPLDQGAVDRDLWEFLRWVVERAGEPWTPEGLDRLAALYRIPEAEPSTDGPVSP
ncbi:hypothetical protein SAMN05661080_01023 [Modestobacter sp. DSM 44400]|uniref:hypothetical protein n=1 Tax=Modestobacter sp. DSM 44400 TaxID=1550230 RepID=UPI00089B2E90|nr:hypothetical protein [Modestobacter sp. DSM 44400]SDX74526.1 hypothetical protein SAMN05661080_01023 [Modestobacter sp. DSM 44400]